jgi:hypothetical protein
MKQDLIDYLASQPEETLSRLLTCAYQQIRRIQKLDDPTPLEKEVGSVIVRSIYELSR